MFEREEDLLGATRAARARGLAIVDAYVPYAVHGLDEAMGLRPSRLPWICFALGVLGAAFKVWFEFWTTAVDWPIDVGGKPWNSLPAFVPVTFEVMVLFAGLSTVLVFFVGRRLLPGRRARLPVPGVTDDRFALLLEESDAGFDPRAVEALLREHRALQVKERVAPGSIP
ncbi:MAG: DUF3341 domain-containing protein [Planctomycetota bacterium]